MIPINERGSAQIVEMTIVLPLVCISLLLTVVAGIYIYQVSALNNIALCAADLAAMEEKIPGYVNYYGQSVMESGTFFGKSSVFIPDTGTVNTVSREHDPYRYYFGNDSRENLEAILSAYVSECSVIPGDYNCEVLCGEGLGGRLTQVRLTGEILPVSLGVMKIGGMKVDITAKASSVSSAETVRNTELVYSLCNYLWNDLKLGSDSTTLKERVGSFSDYFKSVFKGD